ncbi:hypothetical protein [Pontibacter chitinilyticus]|uniref:hypothetical protein n=1 Tax=Pontibacter chitinilyticus TaxID=2674989 RepID=UPI00321A53CA
MAQKIKPLPIGVQALNIKRIFTGSNVTTFRDNHLTWTDTISSSPLGELYKVKLEYHVNQPPKVYVIKPKPLPLAKGKTKLPHCYDQKEQQLCLYYPDGKEWNKTMLLATTIIPWTYEWLYHYEIWLGTGEWTGGGVHARNNLPKKQNEHE